MPDRAESVVQSYFEAHNRHEIDKVLSFCHPDIVFDLENTWVKYGHEEIRQLEEWDSTLNSQRILEITRVRPDSIFSRVIERNDWFKAAGIEEVVHDQVLFIIEKDKIRRIEARPSARTAQELLSVMGSLVQWSQITGDSTLFSLMEGGEFVYSEEAALQWLDLLTRYNADLMK